MRFAVLENVVSSWPLRVLAILRGEVEVGDEIFLLRGCSKQVALRLSEADSESESRTSRNRYLVISEVTFSDHEEFSFQGVKDIDSTTSISTFPMTGLLNLWNSSDSSQTLSNTA
jgi:hypothetical protein